MAWFDETCITSDNIDMNDCRRINCVALLHCTCIEAVIDVIGGCNLIRLKMTIKHLDWVSLALCTCYSNPVNRLTSIFPVLPLNLPLNGLYFITSFSKGSYDYVWCKTHHSCCWAYRKLRIVPQLYTVGLYYCLLHVVILQLHISLLSAVVSHFQMAWQWWAASTQCFSMLC